MEEIRENERKDALWGKSQTRKETKGKNQTPKKQDIRRKVLPKGENKGRKKRAKQRIHPEKHHRRKNYRKE